MRNICVLSGLSLALALAPVGVAEGAAFLRLQSGATTISCDSSLPAVAGGNCGADLGFGVVGGLGSNLVNFVGSFAGYSVGTIAVNGFSSPSIAVASDTKLNITNNSAASDLVIDFGVNGYTLPVGPQLAFSASHTANWSVSQPGDSSSFTGWARADGTFVIPGGTVTANTATLVSPGGSTVPTSASSGDLSFTRLANPYALTGREVLHLAQGSTGQFTATMTVTAIPEPASMVLVGTGLLFAASRLNRRRRPAKR